MVNYSLALVLIIKKIINAEGFVAYKPRSLTFQHERNRIQMAGGSIGGGGGRKNKKNPLDDWLEGDKKKVSGQNERADNRLPISFFNSDNENTTSSSSSGIVKRDELYMADNPYLQTITQVPPAEIIYRFTSTASPRVQDAVKSTILSLIGTLPRMGEKEGGEANFKSRVVTSAERLASLMFQLQLTGYMFKNAEYRMAISNSIKKLDSSFLLNGSPDNDPQNDYNGKIKGKLNIKYAKHEMEVDAESYVSELRAEVKRLREEMLAHEKIKQDQDLLSYIRSLPPTEMKQLTNVSQDVLTAMKGLVNAVMAGIANDEKDAQITPGTILEQSGEAIAQLCMWQLVSGFNLRELEIREEMKSSLRLGAVDDTFTPGLDGDME